MQNERDIEFDASPALPQGADFTPAPGIAGDGASRPDGNGAPLEQAREAANRLVGTAQERATEQIQSRLDAQRHRAAHSLSEVAENLRGTSRNFEGQTDGIGRYIGQAADRVDEIAHFLDDRELSEIVDEVEDFARRQPIAFFGGAFALGILGARFLKSTPRHRMGRESTERWGAEDPTTRMRDPQDAVARPAAPGYAPPAQRYE